MKLTMDSLMLRASAVAPSRGRGLKQVEYALRRRSNGRPFTGAWIETINLSSSNLPKVCRPFTGAWIETSLPAASRRCPSRRPFTGAWIETLCPYSNRGHGSVAPSRGRGLKHVPAQTGNRIPRRPFTGAWIETTGQPAADNAATSPLHGGVD